MGWLFWALAAIGAVIALLVGVTAWVYVDWWREVRKQRSSR